MPGRRLAPAGLFHLQVSIAFQQILTFFTRVHLEIGLPRMNHDIFYGAGGY